MITHTCYVHSVTQLSLLNIVQHLHSAHIALAKVTHDLLFGASCEEALAAPKRRCSFSSFIQFHIYLENCHGFLAIIS